MDEAGGEGVAGAVRVDAVPDRGRKDIVLLAVAVNGNGALVASGGDNQPTTGVESAAQWAGIGQGVVAQHDDFGGVGEVSVMRVNAVPVVPTVSYDSLANIVCARGCGR